MFVGMTEVRVCDTLVSGCEQKFLLFPLLVQLKSSSIESREGVLDLSTSVMRSLQMLMERFVSHAQLVNFLWLMFLCVKDFGSCFWVLRISGFEWS